MFKRKLLEARLCNGLSQEKMADLIGMTQSNYSRREKGMTKISAQEWGKIAKVLDLKIEDIYEADNHHITDATTSKENNSSKDHYFNVPDLLWNI